MAVAPGRRRDVVILRALGLGDLLTAVPALRALARAFPGHRRRIVAPRWLEPLLPLIREETGPCLHGLVECDRLNADPELLPWRPEIAVNLHGRGPESHLLLLSRRPHRLVAFRNEAVEESYPMSAWDPNEHEAERWCRLLREAGLEANRDELDIDTPRLELPGWADGATLIHPGAASAARRWPPERWTAIARAEAENGRRVLITGSRVEVGLARSIAASAGLDPRAVLAGRTDLSTLAAFAAAADVVVCGDTGVALLATALRTPSVLLFGPTSPDRWGPPADRAIHRVLWEGSQGDPHAEMTDPALLEIEVESVLSELESLRTVVAR